MDPATIDPQKWTYDNSLRNHGLHNNGPRNNRLLNNWHRAMDQQQWTSNNGQCDRCFTRMDFATMYSATMYLVTFFSATMYTE